jgi:predicted enzyme related to lactoylglutathione lyase
MTPVAFSVQVDDLQGALDAIAVQGGRTVTPPLRIGPETSIACFADPAGNVIGLVAG